MSVEFPVFYNDYQRLFRLQITQTPAQIQLQVSSESEPSLLLTQIISDQNAGEVLETSFEFSRALGEIPGILTDVLIKSLARDIGETQQLGQVRQGDVCVLAGSDLQFITIRGGLQIRMALVKLSRAPQQEISNRLAAKVGELTEAVARHQREAQALRQQVQQQEATINEYKQQVQRLQDELALSANVSAERGKYEVRCRTLEQENAGLQGTNQDLTRQCAELQAELARLKSQHSIQVNGLQLQVQNLQEQIDYAQRQFESAQARAAPPQPAPAQPLGQSRVSQQASALVRSINQISLGQQDAPAADITASRLAGPYQAQGAAAQAQFRNSELFARLQSLEQRSAAIQSSGLSILSKYSQFMK